MKPNDKTISRAIPDSGLAPRDPERPEDLKLLADWHLSQGRFQQAAPLYGQLIAIDPTRVEICLALATCFFEIGDKATAESTWEHVLRLEPNNPLARENLAALRGLETRPKSEAPPASELPPLAAEYLTRADEAYSRGDLPSACDLLCHVLAHAAQFVPAQVCLGNLQFQLGQYAAALESYLAAEALEPDTVDLLVRLAAAALRCADVPRFEQALGRALELEPNHVGARRLLADLNCQILRFADAAEGYRQILRQTPRDAQLLLALGRCEFELGDLAAARRAYQQALASNPGLELARENLAVVNEKLAHEADEEFRNSPMINWNEISHPLASGQLAIARA